MFPAGWGRSEVRKELECANVKHLLNFLPTAGADMSTSFVSRVIPPTTERVPRHTDEDINERIIEETDGNVAGYTADPGLIDMRLDDLDREWDIERALEANAAAVSLIGLVLGRLVDRRWYFLSTAVATFLLQHALQGWCPPLGLLRRFRIRTQREIDEERYALKLMRGDFRDQRRTTPVAGVMQAIRR
jgi:hypothetical protein